MRLSLLVLFLATILLGSAIAQERVEVIDAAAGQKITKTYSESDVLIRVERHSPVGARVGTMHFDSHGVPSYAEMYDGDMISGRIFYFPNGNPRREERYDAAMNLRAMREYSESGEILVDKTYDPDEAKPTSPPG